MSLSTYLLFLMFAATTVLSPGPGVVMTLSNALRAGYKGAIGGVLGIALGAFVVAGVSATGLGVVLSTSALAFSTMKYVGAIYLVYLGLKSWVFSSKPVGITEGKTLGFRVTFLEGFTLQLTNPKAIFFFLSVFPQFIHEGSEYFLHFFLLVFTYSVLVIIIHSFYALFAKKAKKWLISNQGSRLMHRVSGSAFIFFGITLALYERR
jgi:homoserine/homoserine lactone efflux protein